MFGEDATLSRVLALEEDDCTLLELPAWQLPSLEALATDAEAKRALWPLLRQWAEAWHRPSLQQEGGWGDRRDQKPGSDGGEL